MSTRVLETVLTGRDLLSPVLAKAGTNVTAFNAQVAGANQKAAASSAAAARAQQASASSLATASGKAATASTTGAAVQSGAADKIAASNVKASTSASASAQQQMRAHAQAAQSATVAARTQESANRALAGSNALLGTSLTPLTAGLGAVGLGLGYAAFKGMDFDKSMSAVRAASQASTGDLERLRQAALDAGADTQYSATEAAAGITELAKAGVSTADILDGGLTGALNLAAAGQLEVADAAEIGATALSVFNLEGDQMAHVADLLAAGAGKAQGSVHDLGAALNQSALVADQTGLSIEDTAGALALFASNGLTGSDAGTSFKTMLQGLTPNSEAAARAMDELGISAYDSQGSFVGLEAFAGQLQGALAGLTEEQRNTTLETIFGSDAVRAASVLYEAGAKGVAEWTANVNDSGFAARQAAALTDNLAGDLEKLGGAVDTFFTSLGEGAQGPLRDAVQMLTVLVNTGGDILGFFSSLPGPVQTAVVAFLAFTALRGPLDNLFKGVGFATDVFAASMKNAGGIAGGFKGALGGLLGAINPVTIGLTLAAVAFSEYATDSAAVEARLDGARAAGESFRTTLAQQHGQMNDTAVAAAELAIESAGLAEVFDEAGVSAGDLDVALDENTDSFERLLQAARDLDGQYMASAGSGWLGLAGLSMDLVSGKATENADALEALASQHRVGEVDAGAWGEAVRAAALDAELAATGGIPLFGDAIGVTIEQTEGAIEAQERWLESLQQVSEGFIEPLSVYKGLLDEKTEAERTQAEAQAQELEGSTQNWENYVTDVTVSLSEYATALNEQITAQENWQTNIVTIAQRGGTEVATILAEMGVEGAQITADMAAATEEDFQHMRESLLREAELAGDSVTGSWATDMQAMERIGRDGSVATVQAVARELNIGVALVREIARKYGIELASGVNPLLTALGVRTVQYSAEYGSGSGFSSGGRADGGFIDGYSPHPRADNILVPMTAGEHVQPVKRVQQYGGDLFEAFRAGEIPVEDARALLHPGRADGGFISAADVPLPPSTAPYQMPISTAGDATMEKAYGETVDWVKANAAPPLSAGIGWEAMMAALHTRFPGLALNSGFRPGSITATGNLSYHAMGRAVDVPPSMDVFNWIAEHYPNSRELIFSPAGGRQLWNGAPHLYSEPTRSDHFDHVHWAMANGGVIGEPVSGIGHWSGDSYSFGENGPETVTPGILSREFSPAAQPGYGGVGGGFGAGSVTISVAAAPVRIYLDGKEWRGMARVEAETVVYARDERLTRDLRSARR